MILIVDNEGGLRNMAEICLEAEGYELRHVANGYQAQDVVLKETAAVQLVVTVLDTKPGDGRELLKFVKRSFPNIPVAIFIPNRARETQELLKMGAYAVIDDSKGKGHERLLNMVRSRKEIHPALRRA